MSKERSKNYCSQATALRSSRRVLRVVFKCLSSQKSDIYALMTDGKGLWTMGEILAHVKGVLDLKVKKEKRK